ncbi:hypothetical protein [Pseudacidovorax intermedius]|uniref:Uncharacterized protein n=1 Tax=Pseudacidovorax intermedius TaxID=433924 RepID=A0A147GZU9_9BURK|nr:hypothetical protein [Pseudacidovorax intermedius]KTT23228.1 hypothetical protein NS331_08400 [Pseudacidovorax intermedius]
MSITARLNDTPVGTPVDILQSAEGRFARELEKLLGDDLAPALRAFEAAQDSSAEDLSKEEIRLAGLWAAAFDKARLFSLRELGDVGEAHFSVSMRG